MSAPTLADSFESHRRHLLSADGPVFAAWLLPGVTVPVAAS